METYGRILLIAMPAFLLLVLFEKWYGWRKGFDTVRNMDLLSSLSSGITNVTKDVLGLSIAIISYGWLVENLAIVSVPDGWITYVHPRVWIRFSLLLMSIMRVPGGCIAFVPIDSRLRGGCIACVPRSPDVTRNPVDLWVRLGLAVSSGGQVGRPSQMAGVIISDCGGGYCHRGWCPPCQPPNVSWLSVSDRWPVRLAAHPLHIPPRIAMSRLFVLGLLDEMLNLFTASKRPFIETNPLRRGGPLCPPVLPDMLDVP